MSLGDHRRLTSVYTQVLRMSSDSAFALALALEELLGTPDLRLHTAS